MGDGRRFFGLFQQKRAQRRGILKCNKQYEIHHALQLNLIQNGSLSPVIVSIFTPTKTSFIISQRRFTLLREIRESNLKLLCTLQQEINNAQNNDQPNR